MMKSVRMVFFVVVTVSFIYTLYIFPGKTLMQQVKLFYPNIEDNKKNIEPYVKGKPIQISKPLKKSTFKNDDYPTILGQYFKRKKIPLKENPHGKKTLKSEEYTTNSEIDREKLILKVNNSHKTKSYLNLKNLHLRPNFQFKSAMKKVIHPTNTKRNRKTNAVHLYKNYPRKTTLKRAYLPIISKLQTKIAKNIKQFNRYAPSKYTLTNDIKSTIDNSYVNIVKFKSQNNSFLKGTLTNDGHPLTIYLHHAGDLISSSIMNSGGWEQDLVSQFKTYIAIHPDVQVLDAGCNIGLYSLTAASMGCNVVCVDANKENTDRFVQTLIDNNLTDKVTIVLNALSNQRNEFIMSENSGNIGGQYVIESKSDPRRVRAIFMDDLIPLFDKSRPIMVKIDIEGKEIDAFRKACRFFDKQNIKLVMIEWMWIKSNPDIEYLIDFLTKRHFKPYKEYASLNLLDVKQHLDWPTDIIWIKQ